MERSEIMKSKLFNLTDDSEWEELGVGYPCIEKVDDKYFLKVYKEGQDIILYEHQIVQKSDIEYEQSEEKVINFNSEEKNLDMAISFQSEYGAKILLDKIKEAEEQVKSGQMEDEDEQYMEYLENKVDLSIPTYNNLETILKELMQLPNDRKVNLSTLLTSHKIYMKKFGEIFDKAEHQKDEEKLKNLCSIMKQIIQNGEHELYEYLLNDSNYLIVFGILEYDTDVFQKQVITHRQFLKTRCKFHKVVDIKDETKIEQIHFNYRLQYLKDCALGHFLDDRAINIIQIISQKIYYDLISFIATNKEILGQITDKLRNMDIKALKFLHELFSALKTFDTQKQEYVLCFHEVSAFEIMIEDIFQNTKGEKKSLVFFDLKKKVNKTQLIIIKRSLVILF